MKNILIISASVRDGRKSHRVSIYFKNYITENKLATAELFDLKECQFPIFDERLRNLKTPDPKLVEFSEKVKQADGILIITPEYNGGYPSSLKNVVDALNDEWFRKPVAISTVSDGAFGGMQVITSLQFSLWKIKAWTVPALFPVPKVSDNFDEEGNPKDKVATDKRAAVFLDEIIWCMEAKKKMDKAEDKK
ncbi:MAG: NAD(P)H-dependent oxidoreductase [Bacteroidota bacterium]|nr:NAD(P)H-dependent oxidoreductase [Bacteroidota bacterium]